MNLAVDLDEVLGAPVDAVWRALTDPAAIADWLMAPSGFRPEVGARFRLKTRHLAAAGWIDAEVTELEPPRRMVWSWDVNDGSPPTTVTFELETAGDGTRLRLRHTGEIDPEYGRRLVDGWPGRLVALADTV
jgi:uncharacterized protein YndB with AHSA1/START domain